MSTKIRPCISRKNDYYISKERYYELKHFCLQYPEWRSDYIRIKQCPITRYELEDPTGRVAVQLADLEERMHIVEECAKQADSVLGVYIFKAVTEGRPFPYLKTVLGIPCERDMYYDRYRKFFYLLSKER